MLQWAAVGAAECHVAAQAARALNKRGNGLTAGVVSFVTPRGRDAAVEG
jgi:hypothetical protein